MKRAIRKLLSARPNSLFVNVTSVNTDYAEFGKCRQNSYNTVLSNSDRYEFVTGWVVHNTENDCTVVHGHWWNYDRITKQHIDTTQKFFNVDVCYVVDMDIGKILTKYEMSMGDRLDVLFDGHPQVIGDLILQKDDWYAWDDPSKCLYYKFGQTVDAQKLFAMSTFYSIEKRMKPEVLNQFKTYLESKQK